MQYLEITAIWRYEDPNGKSEGTAIIPCSYEKEPTKEEIIALCKERVEHSGRWYVDYKKREIMEPEFKKHPLSFQYSFG